METGEIYSACKVRHKKSILLIIMKNLESEPIVMEHSITPNRSPADRLPKEYVYRMHDMLGDEFDAFIESYNRPPERGLLLNTLRMDAESFLNPAPWQLTKAQTSNNGYIINGDASFLAAHPYHRAGLYYMQEPSAMSVAHHAGAREGMRVLDMCAAPGGKTIGLAIPMKGTGVLVSNDFVFKRAVELKRNIERMGATNTIVTSCSPETIAQVYPEYFDIVVVDAPCSGEGMFRKNPSAALEWSVSGVKTCASRQSGILSDSAKAVAPGGRLIYSTCTFSPDENECVVEHFISCNPDFSIVATERLYPHKLRGEGHFVCIMERSNTHSRIMDPAPTGQLYPKQYESTCLSGFLQDCFITAPQLEAYILVQRNKRQSDKEQNVFFANSDVFNALKTLTFHDITPIYVGIPIGSEKSGRFEPSHALFMAAHDGEYRRRVDIKPDSDELMHYLNGEEISCPDTYKGYCIVSTDCLPIGFGKATDGHLKNKLPKGLRSHC